MWFKLCNLPVQMAIVGHYLWVRRFVSVYLGESIDLEREIYVWCSACVAYSSGEKFSAFSRLRKRSGSSEGTKC